MMKVRNSKKYLNNNKQNNKNQISKFKNKIVQMLRNI